MNKIISITGASGAGKSTLEQALLAHFGGGRVRTITTRPPRVGETDKDYDFQTKEGLKSRTDLLWCVPIHGYTYSVARSEFFTAAKQTGGIAFVSITPERHEFLAGVFSTDSVKCIPVHLMHPGDAELTRRLKARGESAEAIAKRLADSTEFERSVNLVTHLNKIEPASPEEVFLQVLKLIG